MELTICRQLQTVHKRLDWGHGELFLGERIVPVSGDTGK